MKTTRALAAGLAINLAVAGTAAAGVVFPPSGYLAEEAALTVMVHVGAKDSRTIMLKHEFGGEEQRKDLDPGFNRWDVTLKLGKNFLWWGSESREIYLPFEGKDPPEGFAPAFLHEAMDDCENCHAGGEGTDLKGELVEVCGECHDDPSGGEEKKKVVHSPVADDDCLSCHRPHSSARGKLLDLEAPALCLECHDDVTLGEEEKAFATQHEPVKEGSCLDCHAAHASDFPSLTVKELAELCRDCHDDPRADDSGAARKAVHEPVGDGDCLACHRVHGSGEGALLTAPSGELCKECHDGLLEGDDGEPFPVIHEPAGEDDCLSCHDAHSSDNEGMTLKGDGALCLECHDDPTLDDAGKKQAVVHEAVGDGCLGCHRPHGSAAKGLLASPSPALCLECHDDVRLSEDGVPLPTVHRPVEEGKCGGCHVTHAGPDPKLLLGRGNKLCFLCHEQVHERHQSGDAETVANTTVPDSFPREKPLGDLTCTGCHVPHASMELSLFPMDQMTMCAQCHRM